MSAQGAETAPSGMREEPMEDERMTTPGWLTRRELVGAGLAGLAAGAAAQEREMRIPPFELQDMDIATLQRGLEEGRWSSTRLVQLYLERIEQVDRGGPRIRQVLEINPDALSDVAALDAERRDKGPRGPLHGIPVLIKDNISTRDRMATTAGSLALEGAIPPRDAFIVQRLRAAGAILLGKTNLSEWANFRSTRSSSGWSARGGQSRNPHALDRNTSGSSSGSGGAAAASLAAGCVGTETDGSIISPSAACGVVGLKPTVGLLSRSGIIPISETQDTAGPMCRTVRDAALLLGAMTGADPRDPATRGQKAHRDYTRFLQPGGLKGARIGLLRGSYAGYHPKADKIAQAAFDALKSEGAQLTDPANLPAASFSDAEFQVLLYEFKDGLNRYLASLGPGARVKSLEDVIAFNDRNADREMPYFGQEIFLMAQKKGPLTEERYLKALEKCRLLTRRQGIDALMDKHRLDALVALTQGPAWLIDLVNGDSGTGGSCTSPAAVAGYPHITVPAGFVHGLPVGISFIGRAWSEPVLLRLAHGFEQATRARRAPRFRPTADL